MGNVSFNLLAYIFPSIITEHIVALLYRSAITRRNIFLYLLYQHGFILKHSIHHVDITFHIHKGNKSEDKNIQSYFLYEEEGCGRK